MSNPSPVRLKITLHRSLVAVLVGCQQAELTQKSRDQAWMLTQPAIIAC